MLYELGFMGSGLSFAQFFFHSLAEPLLDHALVIQIPGTREALDAGEHPGVDAQADGDGFGAFDAAGARRLMRASIRGSMRKPMATDSELSTLLATADSIRRRSGRFSAQKSTSATSLSNMGTSSQLAKVFKAVRLDAALLAMWG